MGPPLLPFHGRGQKRATPLAAIRKYTFSDRAGLIRLKGTQMSTFPLSWRPSSSPVIAYGLAVGSVTAALAIAWLLDTYLQTMPYVSLFLCAIMFVAWVGGLGPSLLAVATAALYFVFFLLPPQGSFEVAANDIPRVVLFLITALFVVALSAAQRRSSKALACTNEALARTNEALRAENADRRRAEAYLDEAQALSRTGYFAWKPGSGEIFLSSEGYRVLDIDRDEKPARDLVLQRVHPHDRASLEAAFGHAQPDGQDYDFELRWLAPVGSTKRLHVHARRLPLGSGEEELVGAVMDVTEARKAQDTLQATQTALAHATRVATLGEMSASIAHEVNQPLASIVANGEAGLRWLNRKEPVLAEVDSAMKRIVRDATRASEVVQRLRALARKAPVEKQPLDLNDVIRESIALLQREIAANRVTVQADLEAELAPVLADRIELQQVVINLMVNGIQALATVTDRPRRLLVRSSIEENGALVAIQDSGVGLDASTAARLFSPFFTTRESGMGLGLSICRSIVEAHGGRICASANDDGPGATFWFSLPFQQEPTA